jgi:hypothetical protein
MTGSKADPAALRSLPHPDVASAAPATKAASTEIRHRDEEDRLARE